MVEDMKISSKRVKKAMLKVKREEFMPQELAHKAYHSQIAYSIPGNNATISAPNTYPLFYESLDLGKGDKFLEIGTGSGYGACLAKEVVGEEGQVYSIEIDEITYKFGRKNLRKAGYQGKVKIIKGDGSKGYPHRAPFNKIAVTASVNHVPGPSTWPLLKQLKMGGKLIAPEGETLLQNLVLLAKEAENRFRKRWRGAVTYVRLQEGDKPYPFES